VHDGARGITSGAPSANELNDLADLLSGCLHMNIEKRFSPTQAMTHKFFSPATATKPPAPKFTVVKPNMMKRGTVRR
jgi:serine/threonine-protein kinase PRP4